MSCGVWFETRAPGGDSRVALCRWLGTGELRRRGGAVGVAAGSNGSGFEAGSGGVGKEGGGGPPCHWVGRGSLLEERFSLC